MPLFHFVLFKTTLRKTFWPYMKILSKNTSLLPPESMIPPFHILFLNAELGRFCPFSAPRGHTFSTCPPRFPPRVFHGQIFTPDKHKVSAPNAPHPKVIQIVRPWENWRDLKKIDFQHTTITLGLVKSNNIYVG